MSRKPTAITPRRRVIIHRVVDTQSRTVTYFREVRVNGVRESLRRLTFAEFCELTESDHIHRATA